MEGVYVVKFKFVSAAADGATLTFYESGTKSRPPWATRFAVKFGWDIGSL